MIVAHKRLNFREYIWGFWRIRERTHAHAHTKIDDVIKKSENRENQKIDDVIKKSENQ